MPFPWQGAQHPRPQLPHANLCLTRDRFQSGAFLPRTLGSIPLYPKGPTWSQCLPPSALAMPSLQSIVEETSAIGSIDFRLPKLGALAGAVLKHATLVVDSLFERHAPMLFKLGYTHNPCWRWSNHLYGYCHAVDKWSNMRVLYIAMEPYSVAMLEAALIDKYGSNLLLKILEYSTSHDVSCWIFVDRFNGSCPFISGKPGCRNVRRGGETVDSSSEGPYMCYCVYRSLKERP